MSNKRRTINKNNINIDIIGGRMETNNENKNILSEPELRFREELKIA